MNKCLYHIIYSIAYLHALLPFWVLYILSDIFYVLLYKIVGYRLRVVRRNLANAFPDKTEKERRAIEREFYHHFCDYFFETIKALTISKAEMKKRFKVKNMEMVNDVIKRNGSALMFMGHYGNWEWGTSVSLWLDEGNDLAYIYRPLKNKAFDNLFLKLRSLLSTISIPKNNTLRGILGIYKDKKHALIAFLADQTPSVNNIHYWTTFLNQDSAVFTGGERIAKQTGFAIVFLDVQKVKRGYYECEMKLITDDPKSEKEFAITERYIRAMENTILRNPAYWLWTHKRWKRTREEVEALHRK